MTIHLTTQFEEDLNKIRKENQKLYDKIWVLIKDIYSSGVDVLNGIGKPEKLKGDLSGCMSRRIDKKHRLIYIYDLDSIKLISCYGHYAY